MRMFHVETFTFKDYTTRKALLILSAELFSVDCFSLYEYSRIQGLIKEGTTAG